MRGWIERVSEHFECGLLAFMWLDAALIAVLVGRPTLGAIGVVTVLPVLVAYTLWSCPDPWTV